MNEITGPNGLTRLRDLVTNREFQRLQQHKECPIVLVPGFSGWGPPLLGAVNYWGGVEDLPRKLRDEGYTVIIATIAPISSNWERACELYAQLTSGSFSTVSEDDSLLEKFDLNVSYGKYFDNDPSNRPTVTRTSGRRRAVLLPSQPWIDKTWKWSKTNKVHFICHSQGGNTVRRLISLMQNGAGGLHDDYFSSNETDRDDWTISVSTLGTPYKGTTVTNVLQNVLSEASTETSALVGRLFATLSFQPPSTRAYDLQLDHWEICRQPPNETFQEMRARLERPGGPVSNWLDSLHTAFYDNSIEGVEALHQRAGPASLRICYFTFSFCCTKPFPTTWPPWVSDALSRFPASLYDITKAFLSAIPGGSAVVWVLNSIRHILTSKVAWPIIQTQVKFRDFVGWGTVEVARRLLMDEGFNIKLPTPGDYVPRKDVFPPMLPTVYAMGSQQLSEEQESILGVNRGDWLLNDGIVNTESMRAPKGATVSEIERSPFPIASLQDGQSKAEICQRYWHFGTTGYLDHADEIGVWIEQNAGNNLKEMYTNLAALVSRIPPV